MNGTGSTLEIYLFVPTSCYVEHLRLTAEKENNHHSKPWVKLVSIRSLDCNETERKQNGTFAYVNSPPSLPPSPFSFPPAWVKYHISSVPTQALSIPTSVSSLQIRAIFLICRLHRMRQNLSHRLLQAQWAFRQFGIASISQAGASQPVTLTPSPVTCF